MAVNRELFVSLQQNLDNMRYLFILLSALTLMTACSHDDESDPVTDKKATRAVMIYMAGENNLTEYQGVKYLSKDLDEIVKGSMSLSDTQRLFVFVDSLNSSKAVKKGTPYIIEVHGGKIYPKKSYESDFYSSDPKRFTEIIKWMTDNIQADGYGLVLWGHADGWLEAKDMLHRSYGIDTGEDAGSYEKKWMGIRQMAEALNSIQKLDFIFADCCNMMSAEVGYELRHVTDYLIGSPAEIPGYGAPYDLIVPYFFKNGEELYKGIIDTYYNYYQEAYVSYSVPLSVIDTKYMEQLAQATHDVLDPTTYPNYPSNPNMKGIVYYWYCNAPIFYDMRAFLKSIASDEAFAQWDNVFQQAVPYYKMSMQWETGCNMLLFDFRNFNQDQSLYGCVSMFVPVNSNRYKTEPYYILDTYNYYQWNQIVDWSRFGWN